MAWLLRLTIVFFMTFTMPTFAWSAELAGLWEEYNDDTGNIDALIRIQKLPDGTYEGRIEKLANSISGTKCTHCQGDLHNRPLVGLRILWRMIRKNSEVYAGGEVLDPDDGRIYPCSIRLSEDGTTIEVTGYLGQFWIGQSEIWKRAH